MKHYLVTGANGWLGKELKRRLDSFDGEYCLDAVSLRDESWKDSSWSDYDGVFHFAAAMQGDAIVDISKKLAADVAIKCKQDQIPFLLFMSSFSVYGADNNPDILVNETTPVNPVTEYGKSKVESEQVIKGILDDSSVSLAIVRAPLIFGPGEEKGNFPLLVKLSKRLPFFIETKNTRSMIYSQNLCELCRILADRRLSGVFLPQDSEYYDTSETIVLLGEAQGHKVRIIPRTLWLSSLLKNIHPKFGKMFGNARYEMSSIDCELNYKIYDPCSSLRGTIIVFN